MRRFTIGRAAGIPIRIDLTLLLALAIIAFEIGTQVERIARALDRLLGLGVDGASLAAGSPTGGPTSWSSPSPGRP